MVSMLSISDEEFAQIISHVMDELPEEYVRGLNNVVVTYDDVPSEEQRRKQKLRPYQTLFGLYEGIPRTQRNNSYSMVLPDKITIFKQPILSSVQDHMQLKAQVKHTLWHEIAHHYGLDHDRIHEIEANWR